LSGYQAILQINLPPSPSRCGNRAQSTSICAADFPLIHAVDDLDARRITRKPAVDQRQAGKAAIDR
jgi:hypothetical protein